MRAARREVEEKARMRVAEQAREEREERERRERKQNAERLKKEREEWRRWARGQLPSEPADVKSGIRVMVRLPANSAYGGRAVRIFPSETTIDSLFNWVETLFIPTSCRPEDDPQTAPGGRKIWTEEDGGEVIRLYTAYPRAEVTREGGWKVVKDAGGSLVVEVASDGEGSDGEDEDESEEE
jgi:FAS-associated factor 2